MFWKKTVVSVCIAALAAIAVAGCGKHVKVAVYTYEENDEGKLVITGLTDKGKEDMVLKVPASIDGKEVIGIGSGAFREDSKVTEVVIADGITYVSENVFLNCYNLKTIDIPESVKTIGTNTFTGTEWEYQIFKDKDEVVVNDILCAVNKDEGSYIVPDGVVTIASGVFYNKTGITSVDIPDSVEEIGTYAFSGCTGIEKIELPSGLKRIGYGAFANMSLKNMNVPAGVDSIGNEAFLGISEINYKGKAQGSPWGADTVQ